MGLEKKDKASERLMAEPEPRGARSALAKYSFTVLSHNLLTGCLNTECYEIGHIASAKALTVESIQIYYRVVKYYRLFLLLILRLI